jgi:hypothetical protein
LSVPSGVRDHLFLRYLQPVLAFGDGGPWRKEALRAGELALVVEEVTADRLRLRLQGFAHLGQPFDPDLKVTLEDGESQGVGYEARLDGYLDYDRAKEVFTRFDVVVLGDYYGKMHGSLYNVYRPGRQPLGIAWELIDGKSPAGPVP